MRVSSRGVLWVVLAVSTGCATPRAVEPPPMKATPAPAPAKTPPAPAPATLPAEATPAPRRPRYLSPAEILRRVQESKTHYVVQSREKLHDVYPKGYPNALWPRRVEPLAAPQVFSEGGVRRLRPYPLDPKAVALMQEAETLFEANKYAEAAKIYERVTREFPDHYVAWAYLGDCELNMGDAEAALKRYQKAGELNPDDYRIPFFQGRALLRLGRIEEARQALAWSLVLNPRNQLLRDMLEIQPVPGFELQADVLAPEAFVRREADDKVAIYLEEKKESAPWYAWANCKALWLGEPSHREEMTGKAEYRWVSTEETECLVSLVAVYMAQKQQKQLEPVPALERIEAIFRDHMADELVLFELGARVLPQVTLIVPPQEKERLRAYVLKYVLPASASATADAG